MKIQNIKVAFSSPSESNPRGTGFESTQAFKDLVASIKEKGILVPVIAREIGSGVYEVVAGSRRLAAAKKAGLETIPADVRKMTDTEAREIQIIENLQRADVHPLEEGKAYRQLHELEHQEIKSIAAKVGKSEDYIKQRMFLTNLSEAARKAYRAGDISDGFAIVIAKLDQGDQIGALKYAIESASSIKDLQFHINNHIYKPLENQPWIGSPELEKIVGPCKECPPSRSSLFGEVKEGYCTTLKCWQRKMSAYIAHQAKTENLLKISHEYVYSGSSERKKDVLYSNDFKSLSTKTKEHCEFAKQAVVVEGNKIGNIQWICASKDCKKHNQEFSSGYQLSPAEKARRKKEIAADQAKRKKALTEIHTASKKVKWPISEKHLEALIAITLQNGNSDPQRLIVKSKGWEIIRTKTEWQPKGYADYRKTLIAEFAKLETKEKAQLLFEVLLNEVGNNRNQILKML